MKRRWTGLFALLALAGMSATTQAGDDCQCDCYFSFDCNGGQFCDYGSSFTIEDECWWRTPKPEGSPGTGCDGHYGDWGQCDGKCAGTAEAAGVVGDEKRGSLLTGIYAWGQAFNAVSIEGGGVPAPDEVNQIEALDFANPSMAAGLWRMTLDIMVLARGSDYVIFPDANEFYYTDVAVGNLQPNGPVMRNGNLAIAALATEVSEPGSGLVLMDQVDIDALDAELFSKICESGDYRACLYERITTMAEVLRHSTPDYGWSATDKKDGGTTTSGVEPVCPGCAADCAADDVVDVADVLELLADYGAGSSCSDINDDGSVNTVDLLMTLAAWGPCAQ